MNAEFSNSRKEARRALRPQRLFAFWALAAALFLFLSGSTPVFAQGALTSHISLRDTADSFDLGPALFIVHDPAQNLTYNQVLERYRNGMDGSYVDADIVRLGSKPVGHWMVVSVSNESWNEDWMLSFGANLRGRLGQLSRIFVYDDISRTRFIDTINLAKNPYMAEGAMMGAALPMKLTRGKKALLVMYVMPETGLPVHIAPRLVTAHSYMDAMNNPINPGRLVPGVFMVMMGFFLGTLMFRRMWSSSVFILYYALLLFLFQLQNDTAVTKFTLSSEIMGLMFAMVVVSGIFAAQTFLEIRNFYRVQARAIGIAVAFVMLSGLIGAFIISDSLLLKPALMLLPGFLGLIFIMLLGFAQAQSGKYAAYPFAFSWVFPIIGAFTTGLAVTGIVTPSNFTLGAFWISLMPQAAVLIFAAVTRAMMVERDELDEKRKTESEAESIALLKQSRDASENARLLRVIDHERQVMNELREREIKQSEEMRKARDAADEANRAKSAFLAVISHEIRTPMSGIMGMVRLLLDTKLSKDQHDYAQTIQDSGDAMLSLLNDILDFEKIESGKMDLEHIDFDLPRMMQGVVTLMSGHADTKGISLKADIDPSLPRFVIGDPVRLRQVLLNLVGNSIKFTEHGGVSVHVKRDDHGNEQKAGVVRIRVAVQDTGVGISKEAQKNLFNPFAQADSSVSRRFGGTGLGLAISQRLIESMGGKIAIDSIEGRGSTFYFTLIMEEGSVDGAQSMSAARSSPLAGPRPEKVLRILVVEDNEISQKLMREFIQRIGHEITLAETGEEGLRQIESQNFDMVLMDVELPGISGIGATKAIRAMKDDTKARLPVIAMTGNVRDEDVHSCYAANMNGHLAKPIDPQKLRDMIQKVIDNKLDNPVVVDEDRESFGVAHQTEIKIAATPYPGGIKAAAENSVSPLREALLSPGSFELAEDDLDSDSFAEAIERHEVAESAPTSTDVLDSRMLHGLREGMNGDAVRSLIDELFEKAEQIIADMQKAAAGRDASTMAARAHELKGMAGNFGLVEVSRIAEKAERAAKEDLSDGIEELLADLAPANDRARAAMNRWLAGK